MASNEGVHPSQLGAMVVYHLLVSVVQASGGGGAGESTNILS